MSTVILLPVLGRPHRVEPLLASIAAATPEPHQVLFIVSPGDRDEHRAIDNAGAERITINTLPGMGDYARKINLGYRETVGTHLFLGADDLDFRPHWLTRALRAATGRIGVVGTQDLGSQRVLKGSHSTHSLVVRDYIDQYGTIDERDKILHEGYWHEFVDDELVGTAKFRKTWTFCRESVVEHLHPCWGKAPTDVLYADQARRMRRSRPLFEQRKPLWGGR